MHKEMIEYSKRIKARFPEHFKDINFLDVGSLDINGTNEYLFKNCCSTGIDIMDGKNVDIVNPIHKIDTADKFNTIICTEMLEHDCYIYLSLRRMIQLLKPGGLLLITAAHLGREEHGTNKVAPSQSPATNDYYRNVDVAEFIEYVMIGDFIEFGIEINESSSDIYFFGIKK